MVVAVNTDKMTRAATHRHPDPPAWHYRVSAHDLTSKQRQRRRVSVYIRTRTNRRRQPNSKHSGVAALEQNACREVCREPCTPRARVHHLPACCQSSHQKRPPRKLRGTRFLKISGRNVRDGAAWAWRSAVEARQLDDRHRGCTWRAHWASRPANRACRKGTAPRGSRVTRSGCAGAAHALWPLRPQIRNQRRPGQVVMNPFFRSCATSIRGPPGRITVAATRSRL